MNSEFKAVSDFDCPTSNYPTYEFYSSTYSHLQDISVQLGDYVNRGEIIGVVGSTGRSTGAHLDWRINWLDKRLDPQLIANKHP